VNHVQLMGSIVQNDLRYTPNGKPILETTIAGNTDGTWYQRVTLFGKTAETHADLPTGTILYIHGRLVQDRWEAKDGSKRSAVKVLSSGTRIVTSDLQVKLDAKGQPVLQPGLHAITLAGNLTRDAEEKDAGPSRIVKASLAVNDRRLVNNEWTDDPHYFELVAWNDAPAAGSLRSLTKGSSVLAFGRLDHRSWEGKDGSKRYATDVKVTELHPLGKANAVTPPAARLDIDAPVASEGALPF